MSSSLHAISSPISLVRLHVDTHGYQAISNRSRLSEEDLFAEVGAMHKGIFDFVPQMPKLNHQAQLHVGCYTYNLDDSSTSYRLNRVYSKNSLDVVAGLHRQIQDQML